MFSAVFEFLSSVWRLLESFMGALGSLTRAFLDVLAALVSAILWPVRAVADILLGRWNVAGPWTPFYFLVCGILFLALIVLAVWIVQGNRLRRKNH